MEYTAAAAKSLQSCPTLCDPIDGSPPGSPVPGILQARTLEWVAISFSNAWKWKEKGKSLSRVWLFATPWTAAYQAPLSMGFSRQVYWSGVPLPSLKQYVRYLEIKDEHRGQVILTIVATNSLEKRKNSDIWAGPWCTLGKKGVKILESSTLLKHEQWLSGNIKLLNRSGIKAAWENDRKVGRKSALRPDYKMGLQNHIQ